MKTIAWLLAILLTPFISFAGQPYTHEFKVVDNDPYKVLQYELSNGLKIYLSVNKDEPRVSTNIAVRTGSKNDPSDVTGLAHYLEHMLFKGTSKLGSLDWPKEKALLDQISANYEKYRKTTDPEKRKSIYAEIDRLSGEASKLVATNEYDQMIGALGAKGTNAYTSLERTVYINDIPANEMEKWMMIEAERFGELTLRLFHTELEAVYEEFNRGMDSDGRQVNQARMKALFPNHTYGSQTTIGESEHLKNPSMVKIHDYFKTYYVPNNMAIIMSGDLDPDATVTMIEKYFGGMKKGPTPPQFKDPGQPALSGNQKIDIQGSSEEFVTFSFRLGSLKSGDQIMADLASSILSNGKAGLIDKNINQQQKVIRAYCYSSGMKDYSSLNFGATPREGQTLEEAQQLLLEQLDLFKKGDFDASLISSIVRNAKKVQMMQAENNSWKCNTMIDAFIYDLPWDYYTNYYNQMQAITKQQLVAWANAKLGSDYVSIYKRQGERETPKISKPAITPVTINRDQKSDFRANWENTPSSRMSPEFINFQKVINFEQIQAGLKMYYVPNKTNELFELDYIFDMGSRNDKTLALAVRYLPYLGTDKHTVEEIKRKFYDLALEYSVFAGSNRSYISLNGLDESMEEGMKLFEELLANVKADPEAYNKMVDGILKKRANAKLSKGRILNSAMRNYAVYGALSPSTDILSEEELRAISPDELVAKIKGLKNFKHKVFYYGPTASSKTADLVKANHKVEAELKDYPARKEYEYVKSDKNIVYYVDYDQVQAEILMISRTDKLNTDLAAMTSVFNQYFGSGLSSIVFQEIRESKALAYSAYSVYTSPSRADGYHYVQAYIGTQNDKLQDAVAAMQELMNNMPQVQSSFDQAKLGALKKMETSPITKSSIFWTYQSSLDKSLSENPRPVVYENIQNITLEDLNKFFNENIKGRKFSYLVVGKKELMNMEALSQLGEVVELDLETIFGY